MPGVVAGLLKDWPGLGITKCKLCQVNMNVAMCASRKFAYETSCLGSLGQVCAGYTTSFCMIAMKIIDTTTHKLIGRQRKFTLVLAMAVSCVCTLPAISDFYP